MWDIGPGQTKTQRFIEDQLKRNNKEVIAYLRDKHFECCIFNIVQHHQTFVNKDWNREVLLHWHRKKEMFHKVLCYSLARPSLLAENDCKTILCKYKRPLWHIFYINVVNTSLLIARIKSMWQYPRDIGYQGDLKISKAEVKVWRSNRDQRKLKKINMVQWLLAVVQKVKHCFGNKNQSLSRPDVFIIQLCKHHKM